MSFFAALFNVASVVTLVFCAVVPLIPEIPED